MIIGQKVFRMNKVLDSQIKRLIASGVISDRPCVIFSIGCIGTGASTNIFKLYNGFDTNDQQIMTLGGVQYVVDFRNFFVPLFLSKGVYIEFATNGTECFVQFAFTGE